MTDDEPSEQPILDKVRTMWEFAATTQFLYLFFDMFGLQEFDVEIFEQELLGRREAKLIPLIRLRLLQGLSGNRAISLENLDEFSRKQYLKRKPDANPFGDEEHPTSWTELDVFAHIRILRELCTWQLINAERFRERAGVKDSEQLDWRVDPVGYDADGNTYYLLDDNRLYYRDAPIIPEEKPSRKKFRGKKRKRGARRIESEEPESPNDQKNGSTIDEDSTWHVQCITMDDWTSFLAKLKKSRDLDEKALYRHLNDNVLPTLLEEEAERERERERKEQEYLREQAFAARKRSNRLVQREEDRKHMEEKEAEMAKIRAAEEERKREEQRLKKLEQEREARLLLREQRQRERELRIQQREEERKRAIEEAERTGTPIKFIIKTSASPAPVKKTARQQAMESQSGTAEPESLPKPEESWFFDCLCGKHGTNYDDGTLAVACEKCDIWQHVACLPDPHDREELTIRNGAEEGAYPDYEFICARCRKKAKEAIKADAVKTKEQLRKEKEREANKAKYERRKIREKARKEEERRKREEEQRLGIYPTTAGPEASSPMAEIRVRQGLSSSPAQGFSSPDSRAPGSTGQMYSIPRYMPNSARTPPPYPNAAPGPSQYPNNSTQPNPIPQYMPSATQNSSSSPYSSNVPPRPPQYQNQNHPTHPPPPNYQNFPYQHLQHLPPSQPQPPRHSPQFQSVRPAVQPYWSPYTTSSNLPNGQQFSNNRLQASPYANGSSGSAPQPRNIAIKPAPNPRSQQVGGGYSPTGLQQHPSQSPSLQQRPSKSPEIARISTLPGQGQTPQYSAHPQQSYQNQQYTQATPVQSQRNVQAPSIPAPQNQRVTSPVQHKTIPVPQAAGSQKEPVLPPTNQQQRGAVQPSITKPIPPQTAEPWKENQNGLAKPEAAPVAAANDVKDKETVIDSSAMSVEKSQATNGVTEGDPSADSANDAERTKMSFLLN